jgi:GTP-binding protein
MGSQDVNRRKRRIVPKVARPELGGRARTAGPAPHPFHHAEFLTTAADWSQLPTEGVPEVAFAGRSNAGKSSAINALAHHTRLAFVSKTPGRTQHINFFRLKSGALLADLPGYGYAKVPLEMRQYWQEFIARYLSQREVLAGLALVMDARHPLTELDYVMLGWFRPTGKPVHVLLSKSDKLTRSEAARTLRDVQMKLAALSPMFSAQLFSSTKKCGLEEAEEHIATWLPHIEPAGRPERDARLRENAKPREKQQKPGLGNKKPRAKKN